MWPLTILVKFARATARLRVPPEGSVGAKVLLTYLLTLFIAYMLGEAMSRKKLTLILAYFLTYSLTYLPIPS